MIAELSGTILEKGPNYVVLDVHSVGYQVFTSPTTAAALEKGSEARLYTYLVVREQVLDLYGFTTPEERNFFKMLIGISGIGPRSAVAILSLAPVKTLRAATAAGDISYLTKVSGIGKKSAEKIVLELRDKLGAHSAAHEGILKEDVDTLEALKSLGYSVQEARDALKHVPRDAQGPHERLKHALKALGK